MTWPRRVRLIAGFLHRISGIAAGLCAALLAGARPAAAEFSVQPLYRLVDDRGAGSFTDLNAFPSELPPLTAPLSPAPPAAPPSPASVATSSPAPLAVSSPTPTPTPTPPEDPELAAPLPQPGTEAEPLTLAKAIERAFQRNPDVQSQQLTLKSAKIVYDDAWDAMYMPSVSLNLSSVADKTLFGLPGSGGYATLPSSTMGSVSYPTLQGSGSDPSLYEHGFPSSAVQLSLGQYTLFNFGRDKLVFDQARLEWLRSREAFEEAKRAVKFNVIIQFWTLKSALDKLEAYERSVEIAQAIVELQESRIPLGKATQTDLSSSTVDLINTQNLRDQADTLAKSALYQLNVLLGDPAGTPYRIEGEIDFLPIKVTEEVLYETYLRESPNMKTARKDLTVSQLNLELKEKNLLPLPTIQFSGVTLGYSNGYYGTTPNGLSAQSANPLSAPSNFDISAKINLTIPLLGPGGLLNHRTIAQAQIQVDQKELSLRSTANRDRQIILQLVQNIRQFETLVRNDRRSFGSSVSVLESVFGNIMNTRTVSRLDIRDALNQARDSEIQLTDALVQHLNFKTQLAAFIGVDYLPRME